MEEERFINLNLMWRFNLTKYHNLIHAVYLDSPWVKYQCIPVLTYNILKVNLIYTRITKNLKFSPGWSQDHQEYQGSADYDIDNEVDQEDKQPDGGSWGVPLELLVVREHVAPGHVPHAARVVVVATENIKLH